MPCFSGGHFYSVEMHRNGYMLGLGYNGKIWVSARQSSELIENSKGTFSQTDELELYTYENQRWNVATGFSRIRKPLFNKKFQILVAL